MNILIRLTLYGQNIIKSDMKLNKKHKRAVKRQIDIEEGVNAPKSNIHKNKKKYNRKNKHNDNNKQSQDY